MSRIYKGKTKLRVLVKTKLNLTGCKSVELYCTKPDGSFTSFTAGIKDYENGIVFYDVKSETDFDQSGWWTIWPEFVFEDSKTACGHAYKVFVYEAGR